MPAKISNKLCEENENQEFGFIPLSITLIPTGRLPVGTGGSLCHPTPGFRPRFATQPNSSLTHIESHPEEFEDNIRSFIAAAAVLLSAQKLDLTDERQPGFGDGQRPRATGIPAWAFRAVEKARMDYTAGRHGLGWFDLPFGAG
jgi:hypothetical protein